MKKKPMMKESVKHEKAEMKKLDKIEAMVKKTTKPRKKK